MAIIPTTQNTVARYAAGLYGVKLGNSTLTSVLDDVKLNTAGGVNGINSVLNQYYTPFASMTSAQVAAIVVANAGIVQGRYGLTASNVADAVSIVTAELNAAAPTGNQGVAIANILASWSNHSVNDAVYGAAAKAWNIKIAQAVGYANAANTQDVAFGEINTEFRLSAGGQNRTGTAGDDTFIGVLGTFDNADRIEGGGGFDTLKVQVGATGPSGVVAPNISNVEHLQFQAQHRGSDSGDNNVADNDIVKVDFNTNVTNVTGFTHIENSNSRADLIVEDVRIANNQITKDITVIMRETDPGNVDFGVYFDQNSLRNVSTSASQINLRVLDTYAVSQGLAPLKDSPYGSFTFSYAINGGAVQTVTLASQAMQDAQTFPEMVAAMQAAADTIFGAGVVTVALGNTYTVPDSVTSATVQGTEIVLAAKGNIVFSTPAGSGWLATDVVPPISGLHTSFTVGGSTASELVTVNVILDDVGRGSTGGDLVIGGLSVGETSTSKGVQKFLIEVQDNSKLQNIESTNNTLREVVIVNGVTTRVDNAYNENQVNSGSLSVRGFQAPNDATGNNALPGSKAALLGPLNNPYGFTDVKIIDASAMTGKLDFTAEVTERSIAKYLNLKDGAPAQPAADNQAFVYTGGSNNDVMEVTLDTSVVGARNQLTGREDFNFTVNGGAGNDAITVKIAGPNTSNWYANHKSLKNLTIDAGDGNDTVKLPGTGSAKVMAGTGDDTVYLDNSGTVGAIWTVNQSGVNTDPLAGAVPTVFLAGGKLTVSFAGSTAAGGGVTGVPPGGVVGSDAVAAAYQNGFEAVVDIPTGANYAVTQYHVNQAIKAAINGNAVLNKLLVAEDGPAGTLNIKSLIDGTFAANDLEFVVSSSLTTVAPDVLAAYKAFSMNSAATNVDVLAANTASVTSANLVSGVGVDRGALAVATGSNLNFAVNVTTQGSTLAAPVAGTNEVATFTVAALAAGETVVINGLTITAGPGGATAGDVEARLEAGVAGVTGGATSTGANNAAAYTIGAGAAGTVVYTSATLGNVANLNNTGTGGGAFGYVQGVNAAPATVNATEVFTVTVTGTAGAGEVITFNGTPTAALAAGADGAAVATALGAVVPAGYTVTSVVGNVVTYTATVANTPQTDETAADFISSIIPLVGNGAISTAESDNSVNLGAGTDVVVLGTGLNSNDTVVFTGYGQGQNTIVNFEDTIVPARDLLDFNFYLNGKNSLSGSTDSAREIDITYNAGAVTAANSVTVLNGVFTATDTFVGLTADKLLAAVNSTNAGTANYAGITAATLNALNTYTTTAGATNLVGGVGKAVVLVQNNGNEGEYHVYELSFNGLAANATQDYTAATLIATVDFGNSVAFAQNLLVA